jgi:hypothetical protein
MPNKMPNKLPDKWCKYCGKKMALREINGTQETPRQFSRRRYCDQLCRDLLTGHMPDQSRMRLFQREVNRELAKWKR